MGTTSKLIYSILIGVTILFGCQKEESSKTNQKLKNNSSYLFYEQSNRLVLNSVEDFDSLIDIANDDMLNSIKNRDFICYEESLSPSDSNIIDDNFLSVVLNSDQVIQIKNYLYRINKTSNKVFVLHKNFCNFYLDLINENTTNEKILVFSTEDDVFDLLGERGGNEKALSKSCLSSLSKSENGWVKYADFIDEDDLYGKGTKNRCVFKYSYMVKYDNFGIYRKLFTEFKHKQTLGGSYNGTDVTFVYDVKFKAKNGETGTDSEYPVYSFATNLNTQVLPGNYDYYTDNKEIPHYRGTRCLIEYDLRAWAWMRNRQTLKPNLIPQSGCFRLNDGDVCYFPCNNETC